MKTAIYSYTKEGVTAHAGNDRTQDELVGLVLAFGAKDRIADGMYEILRKKYPHAEIASCSTSGEIFDTYVLDDTVSVTAIEFEDTKVQTACVDISDYEGDSYKAGLVVVQELVRAAEPRHILILSDGGMVNGSELVRAINSVTQRRIPVTGGLAGDGTEFSSTYVGLNGPPRQGRVVAIGFFGERIVARYGSVGGWETFGPEKIVTRSIGNRLMEINGENALAMYKKYLGPYAQELPGSALLFPLGVRLPGGANPVVRTILSVNQEEESMVFAGDVPEGSAVRFMKANFDRVIDAASDAAGQTRSSTLSRDPKLAILISCVGRKIILNGRIEEEVEAVRDIFTGNTLMTGFYSYGEIAPFAREIECQLHNQTMTVTTLDEI